MKINRNIWQFLICVLLATCTASKYEATISPPLAFSESDKNLEDALLIVNGLPTTVANFPFVGLLIISSPRGTSLCTASLFRKQWPATILTAAHCLDTPNIQITVYLLLDSIFDILSPSNNASNFLAIPAWRYEVHPNWNRATIDQDVAVIFLDEDFSDNAELKTVSIPNECCQDNELFDVVGYGRRNESGSLTDTVEFTTLRYVEQTECSELWRPFGLTITDNQLCAVGDNTDICRGDSGGPLLRQGTFEQVGITSFTLPPCSNPQGVPAGFAYLPRYKLWIKQKLSEVIIEYLPEDNPMNNNPGQDPLCSNKTLIERDAAGKSFEIDCGEHIIDIISASYGFNCHSDLLNNQITNLKIECSGISQCDYLINETIIGDPNPNCCKDYQFLHQCTPSNHVSHRTVSKEAVGKTISIDCGVQTIKILSASYGMNCKCDEFGLLNNQLDDLGVACNGQNICHYVVGSDPMNDFAVGCQKEFDYQYQCVDDTQLKSSNASNQTVSISCNDDQTFIDIMGASYIQHCDGNLSAYNAFTELQATCNGASSCNYKVNDALFIDNDPNCNNQFEFEYQCIFAPCSVDCDEQAMGLVGEPNGDLFDYVRLSHSVLNSDQIVTITTCYSDYDTILAVKDSDGTDITSQSIGECDGDDCDEDLLFSCHQSERETLVYDPLSPQDYDLRINWFDSSVVGQWQINVFCRDPTQKPTVSPTSPSMPPTVSPTLSPTQPTLSPTEQPTSSPIECGQIKNFTVGGGPGTNRQPSFVTFKNTVQRRVMFTNCQSPFDTQMRILRISDGRDITAQSVNQCDGDDCPYPAVCDVNFRETAVFDQLEPGYYQIKMNWFNSERINQYSLEVDCNQSTPSPTVYQLPEPTVSVSDCGQNISGTLNNQTDVMDSVQFINDVERRVVITNCLSDFDTQIRVIRISDGVDITDESENECDGDDCNEDESVCNVNFRETLVFNALPPDSYRVDMNWFDSTLSGIWNIQFLCGDDDDDDDDLSNAPTSIPTQPPIHKLRCPAGSEGSKNSKNDIKGCGLMSCDWGLHEIHSIEECRDQCQKRKHCQSFTFAQSEYDDSVNRCRLYSESKPHKKQSDMMLAGFKQIWCGLQPKSGKSNWFKM